MGKGNKSEPAQPEQPQPSPASTEPQPEPSTAPLPLLALPAQFLGAFFELCFPDKRLLELCRELKITTPGYRLETTPPDMVARVLADEYLASEDVRAPLEKSVREALFSPALEGEPASEKAFEALVDLVIGCATIDPLQEMARVAWRALLEPDDKRVELAKLAIEDGVKLLDAPRPEPKKQQKKDPSVAEARELLKKAEKLSKESEAVRAQLAEAKAAMAEREQKLADKNAELRQLQAEHARVAGELKRLVAAGEGRALADARRSQDEARSLSEKLRAAEERLEEAEDRADAAERKLEQQSARPQPQAQSEDALPSAEEAAEFLVPVLTREFYDSIERWDRRLQRAAFEKIHLLAQNWRHPSLRALQLQGVPGYYRIRIATDVRLIYRREGGALEILSLIDREDLDRYVSQARTRQGESRGKSEAPDARLTWFRRCSPRTCKPRSRAPPRPSWSTCATRPRSRPRARSRARCSSRCRRCRSGSRSCPRIASSSASARAGCARSTRPRSCASKAFRRRTWRAG